MNANAYHRIQSSPGAPSGEIFATLLHLSGSTERLVWRIQIKKSKGSNQPMADRSKPKFTRKHSSTNRVIDCHTRLRHWTPALVGDACQQTDEKISLLQTIGELV
jgi:hypothetical protein